jgi:hypothetical protein
LDGASKPVRQLLLDWSSGRLSRNVALRTAAKMLRGHFANSSSGLPARYHGRLVTGDLTTLAALAANSGESVATALLPARRTTGVVCDTGSPQACGMESDHFRMVWYPSSLTAAQLEDDDEDGFPDKVQDTNLVLEWAWAYFHDDLEMRSPTGPILFWWNRPDVALSDGRAISLPGLGIFMPADYDTAYLPVHELFHQFQWTYMADATTFNLLATIAQFNWWMEATAEWATKEYAQHVYGHPTTNLSTVPEAQRLPDFLSTTTKRLIYGNPLTIPRHYGAVAVVEIFTEALGQDFVRQTWEAVDGQDYLNGYSQIDDVLYEHYWGDTGSWVPLIWYQLYTVCDPATSDDRSDAFDKWCSKWVTGASGLMNASGPANSVARPLHEASSSRRGTSDFNLGGGGAAFQDIAVPLSGIGKNLQVTISAPNTSSLAAYAYSWGTSPGDICAADDTFGAGFGSPGVTSFTVSTVALAECANVTIMVLDTDLSHPESPITVSWKTLSTGAVITNGTISLGVRANGSLNDQHTADGTPVSLTYNSTGFDALTWLWHSDSWLVSQPTANDPVIGIEGSYLTSEGVRLEAPVVDFWSTGSEATSIVQIGPFELVQYYHPSADPHAYKLDITLRADEDHAIPASTEPVVYRRQMYTYVDYNDEALPSFVEYVHSPSQTEVAGYTNLVGAFTSDFSELFHPYDLSSLEDEWSAGQGMGMDLHLTAASPQATLYIGAASHSGAAGVVSNLNVGTYLLSTPPREENSGPTATFILAH